MTKLNHQRPELVIRDNYERELRRSLAVLDHRGSDANTFQTAGPRLRIDALSHEELRLVSDLMHALENYVAIEASILEKFADSMKWKKGGRPKKQYATSQDRTQAFEAVEDAMADHMAFIMAILVAETRETDASRKQRDQLLGRIFNAPSLAVGDLFHEPSPRMLRRILSRLSERHQAA